MQIKSVGFSIGALVIIIIIQTLYLKSLPGSLVRIYYARDISDFNRTPAEDMTVAFGGYPFDYRTSMKLSDDAEGEIRELLNEGNQPDRQMLIDIANWVRGRMSFGKSGGFDAEQGADAALSPTLSGEPRGLCDRYANYFAAACQAAGIPARVIELDGHVVPEAFLRDTGRWVMVDPTLGYCLTREGVPLSVAEIISAYKNGNQPEAAVFAAVRGDDSLYRDADESTLREIYLNGFTVVSNQQLTQQKILHYIAKHFSLPIAKVQYVDNNSIKLGRKEFILRSILALNLIVCVLLVLITAVHAFRKRSAP
jgi:hypothetical protein